MHSQDWQEDVLAVVDLTCSTVVLPAREMSLLALAGVCPSVALCIRISH